MDTYTAIKELKYLPMDWDSYGAQPPDDATLARTLDYLTRVTNTLGPAYSQPVVQPIADPGVALIWRDHGRPEEVEVLVTRAGAEWVILKDHRIVEHGSVSDPVVFAREILQSHVSL
jgi:hypothetical protein